MFTFKCKEKNDCTLPVIKGHGVSFSLAVHPECLLLQSSITVKALQCSQ